MLSIDYILVTQIIHQKILGYNVEEILHLGIKNRKG
jgi:hypothetical protein